MSNACLLISKKQLRATILSYKRLLSGDEFSRRNAKLLESLGSYVQRKDFHTIHLFLPIARNREVDLTPLIEKWWAQSRKTVIPVTDFDTGHLSHVLLRSFEGLAPVKFGILEPEKKEYINPDEIDAVILPLVAADRKRMRLGYGGGFYDRFLKKTKAHKIGLCLSYPLDDIIQAEKHDVPMDHLIYYQP